MNGTEMADKLLYDGGVCTLSGTAFGKVGADHIRISYANSRENLKLALERIETTVAKAPTPAGAPA
jgi:aspartate/methionine/tyrosine aminotransferase